MSPALGFDAVAPGLMLFAILLLVGHTASSLSREWELRTLHRYRLAGAGTWSLVAGTGLAQLLLSSLAFGAMLVVAQLMGFNNHGSWLAAYVVILLTAVSVLGLGMMVAAFARGRDEASNLSTLIAVPMGFLSGAFFAIPGVPLWPGATMGLYDLLPTTHAIMALRGVLNDGESLAEVADHLGALAGLALLFLVIGTWLYGRRRMRVAA